MGILGNLFNRNSTTTTQPVPVDPYSNAAMPTWQDRVLAGGGAVVDRATQIYQKNPKLVGGLAVLAGAALLAGIRSRGRT
jgi:hypothetical protein